MKEFLNANKVLIIGLLSAVALVLNELLSAGETSGKALAYAGFLTALSFLANNLRGQWASIAGIIGTSLTTYITMEQAGAISWAQLLMQAVVALLAVATPPVKDRAYEHDSTIVAAKENPSVGTEGFYKGKHT